MSAGVLLRELWQSWRASLRRPGFVLLAGLTLALGVGFSSAFINLGMALDLPINAVQPKQLVVLSPDRGEWYSPVHERNYHLLQDLPGMASIGAVSSAQRDVNFGAGGQPILASETRASRGYLATLGAHMIQGRYFSAEEDRPRGPPAVILAYRFWRAHFDGEHVVGRSVLINGHSMPVVGVLGPHFQTLGPSVDLVKPLQLDPARGETSNLIPVARLLAGASPMQLAAAATARVRAAADAGDAKAQHVSYRAVPLDALSSPPRLLALMVLLNAGLLLVLASNLSNLMLARAQQRRQGLALRAALGAPSGRLLVGAWSEGLLVVLMGCMAGVAVGAWASHAVQAMLDAQSQEAPVLGPWTHVLPIVVVVAIAVVLLSTTAASWRSRRISSALQALHGAAGAGPDRDASRSSRLLLVVQTALAAALVGIGLLLAAAALHAGNAPRGYDVRDAYQFHLVLPASQFPNDANRLQLMQGVIERLRGIPGVQVAGASNLRWFNDSAWFGVKFQDGRSTTVQAHWFGGDYPQALRVDTLQGRSMRGRGDTGEPLVWVSETFARHFLRGAPVGQRLQLYGPGPQPAGFTVAGVVRDTFTADDPHAPAVWIPQARGAIAAVPWLQLSSLYFVVRMHPGHALSATEVATAVKGLAPGLAIGALRPLSTGTPYVIGSLRLFARLVLMLGVATLALAAIGLFAVTSVASSARLREFGVRLALGASPSRLMVLVLRGALLRTLVGLLLGSMLAVLLGLMARAFLFGLGATWVHPWSLVLTWGVLLVTGLLAALPPALRAARTLPTVTLNESAQ
ncbi:MAG: ABC transporter permease [Metallibacterium scheffleri]|jgi:predicted permease|uniref:ABC transporter permease n=1 Tax=Metallibacterium scheffleri TaxID=993689 RepID=UPI0026EF6CC9|nr:ABC transporter permease [Metallibacterium scheffleri]MCK9365867.1 ABC transporter permease [Metallibacterium scheffleri]